MVANKARVYLQKFETLKKLSNYLCKVVRKLIINEVVKSICYFDYLQCVF